MGKLRVSVTVQETFDDGQIMAAAAEAVQELFDSKISEHFVETAKSFAPVGKGTQGGTNKRSFKQITLREASEFPRGSADYEKASSFAFTKSGRAISGTKRAQQFRKAFPKGTKDPEITKFFKGHKANLNKSPDEIQFRNNTLKGAFGDQRPPGRLRDSIVYEGSHRRGNSVVASFAATAPHAAAVHDGFTHAGGPDHKGAATTIAGQPFFEWSLPAIEDDFNQLEG